MFGTLAVDVITEQVEATCIRKVHGKGAYPKLADLEKYMCLFNKNLMRHRR